MGNTEQSNNTLVRSMHDLGAAAWFGGALMGAVGLNGASEAVKDPNDRVRVASAGWGKWAPLNAVAIGAHLVGGIGLIAGNKGRLGVQQGARSNTTVKSALTLAALGVTAWSGALGAKIAKHGTAEASSGVTPSERTPEELAKVQSQQRILQWVIPALTGTILVLGAQQGEQQRPANVAQGLRGKMGAVGGRGGAGQ